jgi:hypothetical protein
VRRGPSLNSLFLVVLCGVEISLSVWAMMLWVESSGSPADPSASSVDPEESAFRQAKPLLGDPAIDFTLCDVEGKPFRLSAVPKVPVVLEFGSFT